MNQKQYETLKGLIAENELACIVFGRAAENYDKNDDHDKNNDHHNDNIEIHKNQHKNNKN